MQWMVYKEEHKYQLNFGSYSSLFVNSTTNEDNLLNPVIEFFQPRSKTKDLISIKDVTNNLNELTSHSFSAFSLSNQLLVDEISLKSKSLTKVQLKSDFLSHIETDGYMLTINTLLEDLLQTIDPELPIKLKKFNIESLIKLLEIDFSSAENEKEISDILNKNKMMLQIIMQHLKDNSKNKVLVFFSFPELYLSPREQLMMKEYLMNLSSEIQIFVITSSEHFIADELFANNYFSYGKQLFSNELLDDLEWESPLEYDRGELEESVISVTRNYLGVLELTPSISNFRQADIVIFKSIDLYVLIFILKRIKFKYLLDLEPERIDMPVFKYVMDIYEKM